MERILSEEELFSEKHFSVKAATIDFGNMHTWCFKYINFAGGKGQWVMIVALDEKKNVLLIEQYQVTLDARLLVLPRGGIDPGRDAQEKANEELQEETWFGAKKLTQLTEFPVFPGRCKASTILYLGEDLFHNPRVGDELEETILHRIPFSDAISLIMQGKITDARTVAWLFYVKEYLHL